MQSRGFWEEVLKGASTGAAGGILLAGAIVTPLTDRCNSYVYGAATKYNCSIVPNSGSCPTIKSCMNCTDINKLNEEIGSQNAVMITAIWAAVLGGAVVGAAGGALRYVFKGAGSENRVAVELAEPLVTDQKEGSESNDQQVEMSELKSSNSSQKNEKDIEAGLGLTAGKEEEPANDAPIQSIPPTRSSLCSRFFSFFSSESSERPSSSLPNSGRVDSRRAMC